MRGEILPPEETGLAPAPALDPVAMLLADKRSPATRRAYAADLRFFFGGELQSPAVAAFVSARPREQAARLAAWKGEMIAAKLAEATVNRRLAAVRSLLKFCHRLGLSATDGKGLVDGERVTGYRDTRGIGLRDLQRLVALPGRETTKGLRDSAILRLLAENALRRAEVTSLDVGDFSLPDRRLQILGKGRGSQKEPVTLSRPASEAVALYLMASGHKEGALFRNLARDPAVKGERLSADGVFRLVRKYGRKIGWPSLAPHKLRHSAITAALELSGGDVRKVQRLSRHAKLETLMKYDDSRADFQGEMTRKIAAALEE